MDTPWKWGAKTQTQADISLSVVIFQENRIWSPDYCLLGWLSLSLLLKAEHDSPWTEEDSSVCICVLLLLSLALTRKTLTYKEHVSHRTEPRLVVKKALFLISKISSACYKTGKKLDWFFFFFIIWLPTAFSTAGRHLAFHNVMIGILHKL